MIATAKKIIARASSIITMLANSVARANRRTIRWAIRKRAGVVYLAAIFWFPVLTIAGATWALVSVHEKPNDLWPIVGVTFLIVKKVMALLYYSLDQGERTIKAFRLYRRRFR
jgi:apolipoprotein N-acyltransferase